jgi:fructose-bisphosphate aldolase/6-deoxy-5-ketofructose 1-phosphate synthase
MSKPNIPLTVAGRWRREYTTNWQLATKQTGRLMLLAGDQKIEHLNDDFFGPHIAGDDANPRHLFAIASRAHIGVFASQLGLIASYGRDYPRLSYLVKLNSKTNLIPTVQQDPLGGLLTTVDQVREFKKTSGLNIVGIGYTLYPGSEFENQMLAEAAKIVYQAHYYGLLAVLWIYPRGQAIKNPLDAHLAAGMAGLGASLGADFVKLAQPRGLTKIKYAEIMAAAGRTGVIFSGGAKTDPKLFLRNLAKQIAAGARGNATGRNLHQLPLTEAVRLANAITAISLAGYSAAKAYRIYLGKDKLL